MTLQTLRLSDGRAVTYRESGAGEALVLIHGVGMCAEAWGPQMAALARGYRVFAVNMPGHGGSDLLADGARLPDYVGWAAQVIAALGCGAVNLAGHSMGALVAAGVAVDHPGLVRRLAVLNSVYRRSDAARQAVLARADALAGGVPDIEAPLARWFGESVEDRVLRAQVGGWLRAVDPAGYAAAYRAFATGDAVYADDWPRIGCPALVLTGDGDANSTADMAQAMAAAAPHGRAVVIAGHRHMVNLTAADAVTAAMADWLALSVAKTAEGTGR